jgi:hypothetical protein
MPTMHTPKLMNTWSNPSETPWQEEDSGAGVAILEPGDGGLSDEPDSPSWSEYPIAGQEDEMDEDERYFLEEDGEDDDDDDSDDDSDYDDGFDDDDDEKVDEDIDPDDDNF